MPSTMKVVFDFNHIASGSLATITATLFVVSTHFCVHFPPSLLVSL